MNDPRFHSRYVGLKGLERGLMRFQKVIEVVAGKNIAIVPFDHSKRRTPPEIWGSSESRKAQQAAPFSH
jgi:hypothetical protein